MATAAICPVVGTTISVLPPDHPSIDLSVPATCPVTNASTASHPTLSNHPPVLGLAKTITNSSTGAPLTLPNAAECPALKKELKTAEAKELDEKMCPVVGTVTSVLPPGHPSVEQMESEPEKVCPRTNATMGSHKGKLVVHPPVSGADGVCPVTKKSAGE